MNGKMSRYQHTPTNAELSTQARTCWALDTSWNLHLHTRLSNREKTRKYMLSFMNAETCRFNTQLLMLAHTWWYYFQPQPNQHMEINAKLLIHIETCVQRSELDTGQHLFLYIIMKILLQRRKLQKDARLSTRANTLSALSTLKHKQPHSQPSMLAYTCWDMSSPHNAQTHANTR